MSVTCVFAGLSIGGTIAQKLVVKRLDIVRAMVLLSNIDAKIGIRESRRWWQAESNANPICSAAISGTDFHRSMASLRLPSMGIPRDEGVPALPVPVRETVGLIPGRHATSFAGPDTCHASNSFGRISCVSLVIFYVKSVSCAR
ncbi:MAG: hypothetical protein GDA36_06220 [Rhodobacteraceae bacterium]|nr:hypothetical protein [Paracoccaceae bacterium]